MPKLDRCGDLLLYALARAVALFQLFGFCFLLFSCASKSSKENSPKFEQYFIQGEQLYLAHCSNCHQKDGRGLGLLYPPLDTSDFMQNQVEDVVCLIKNGRKGELVVNGKTYNQPMPGVSTLSDLEVAEIATYIYNSWNHEKGIIEVQYASKILSTCDTVSAR